MRKDAFHQAIKLYDEGLEEVHALYSRVACSLVCWCASVRLVSYASVWRVWKVWRVCIRIGNAAGTNGKLVA